MKNLPLNSLRAFAAVYETGGIRSAARALQITHSSVSRHVHELEAWIGVDLFEKVAKQRAIHFTPQGKALGRAALKNLKNLTSAVNAIRESRPGNAVTISTTPSLAARWLLPRLPLFQEAHHWVEISVLAEQRLMTPDHPNADVAIRMGAGPWDDFDCIPLMDDKLFPVISPALWDGEAQSSQDPDLSDLKLLHDRDPQASWEAWTSAFGPSEINVRSGPRFASSDLLLRAAVQGMGIALARGRLAEDELVTGRLMKPFGDQHVIIQDAYWIVRPKTKPPRKATVLLMDWLQDQAQEKQD